jgi:hypothetical protein
MPEAGLISTSQRQAEGMLLILLYRLHLAGDVQ